MDVSKIPPRRNPPVEQWVGRDEAYDMIRQAIARFSTT